MNWKNIDEEQPNPGDRIIVHIKYQRYGSIVVRNEVMEAIYSDGASGDYAICNTELDATFPYIKEWIPMPE